MNGVPRSTSTIFSKSQSIPSATSATESRPHGRKPIPENATKLDAPTLHAAEAEMANLAHEHGALRPTVERTDEEGAGIRVDIIGDHVLDPAIRPVELDRQAVRQLPISPRLGGEGSAAVAARSEPEGPRSEPEGQRSEPGARRSELEGPRSEPGARRSKPGARRSKPEGTRWLWRTPARS